MGDLTDVGSYTGAASPSGTFDQGGNVHEWNESIVGDPFRVFRGGSFGSFGFNLGAGFRFFDLATLESVAVGFRVASPVPASPLPALRPLGMATLLGLLGLAGGYALRRRARGSA